MPPAAALNDYGYQAQKYLSAVYGWSLEGDHPVHKPMARRLGGGYDEAAAAEVLEKIGTVSPVKKKCDDLTKLGMSLILDLDTALSVTFRTADGYDGDVSVKVGGSPAEAKKVSGGYKAVVPNIGAHKLSLPYDMVITTAGGDTELSVSALDYAGIALGKTKSAEERNAMIALYRYYEDARAYMNIGPAGGEGSGEGREGQESASPSGQNEGTATERPNYELPFIPY